VCFREFSKLAGLRHLFLLLIFERKREFGGEFRGFVEVAFPRQFFCDYLGRSVFGFRIHSVSKSFNTPYARISLTNYLPMKGELSAVRVGINHYDQFFKVCLI